ncbi:2OG-Fe(II) oxygenase superfamily-domain containing protein [Nitzschia inconspicua]|uniref:2OG-Fe(II) oxygenase superfamily-domain containing protein n=1 Tax=Nitzschia inconspicua TaxID=303405 RepID=A0A9K3PB48_9STRA|nr:2OG-Fe(II) oxygenase superfamily-domain containing protein [Nitzschia inconspicua]
MPSVSVSSTTTADGSPSVAVAADSTNDIDCEDHGSNGAIVTSKSPLRRSKRNIHAIKLTGSNQSSFFRTLQTLFFNHRTTQHDYQKILLKGRRSNNNNNEKGYFAIPSVRRVTNRRQASIYVIDHFLTPSELDYFDEKIRQKLNFERSFVDNMAYDLEEIGNDDVTSPTTPEGAADATEKVYASRPPKRAKRTMIDDTQRTSTFYSFGKLHDTRIAALEQRISTLLGCWVHQIEPLQLVRYTEGQFFGIHHDMGDLEENDSVALPPKNIAVKRRLVTLFCYLNTLEQGAGGATYFPQCGHLRVNPQRGRAVLWSNVTADGQPDARTIHAGEPVKKSRKGNSNGAPPVVKYGLNIWICEE